jgi:hypothetical protein
MGTELPVVRSHHQPDRAESESSEVVGADGAAPRESVGARMTQDLVRNCRNVV